MKPVNTNIYQRPTELEVERKLSAQKQIRGWLFSLTDRQLICWALTWGGLTQGEAAALLDMNQSTVSRHIAAALDKANGGNPSE